MDSSFFISLFDSIPLLVIIMPIIVLSVISLAVFIERYLFYKSADKEVNAVNLDHIISIIRHGNFKEADSLLEGMEYKKSGSLYLNFISEVIDNWRDSDNEMLVRSSSEKAVVKLEKFAGAVSTIATVAPMMGLFGTVTGMMKSFSALSKLGSSVQSNLAAGITEALVTTALGLLVAIPTVIFYNYLVSKMEKHMRFTEIIANGFLEVSDEGKK